jgi:hypothetical protein
VTTVTTTSVALPSLPPTPVMALMMNWKAAGAIVVVLTTMDVVNSFSGS